MTQNTYQNKQRRINGFYLYTAKPVISCRSTDRVKWPYNAGGCLTHTSSLLKGTFGITKRHLKAAGCLIQVNAKRGLTV